MWAFQPQLARCGQVGYRWESSPLQGATCRPLVMECCNTGEARGFPRPRLRTSGLLSLTHLRKDMLYTYRQLRVEIVNKMTRDTSFSGHRLIPSKLYFRCHPAHYCTENLRRTWRLIHMNFQSICFTRKFIWIIEFHTKFRMKLEFFTRNSFITTTIPMKFRWKFQ